MTSTPNNQPPTIESLQQKIAEMSNTIERQKFRILDLSRRLFGKKSERRVGEFVLGENDGQGYLFHDQLVVEAERTAEIKKVQGEITVAEPKKPMKKGGGRRSSFPDHLPTCTTQYELEDDDKSCDNCGGDLHVIGYETTKELERLETAIIHLIKREKYACRGCECGIKTAPGPDRMIEKGLLGPGFIANVAVERFGNHMPYNRLEKKYKAEGLALSRSVLERTMARFAEEVAPIAEQLGQDVLAEPVIFTDDTGVTIARPPDRLGSAKGYVWIYLSRDGKHSYDFTLSREGKNPRRVLMDYKGFVHADALAVYDKIFAGGAAIEVACWCHVRRKFVEAEESAPVHSKAAVERIRQLFHVERIAKEQELCDDERRELRQKHSLAIADELFAWMAVAKTEVLPKSPMGQALRYALRLETALRQFLSDGRLEMENNAAERALRAVAIGRKNWMFFQNEGGGKTAVTLLSLVMTAKAIGLNPQIYLRDIQSRLAHETDVRKLTPHGWKEHFADQVEHERRVVVASFAQV
ncbi:MAG: IS66 family transposase [Planctomycetaceae bacterium]|nr:IS66 family transposase [Planctomycetaceae bacterium]